MIKPGDRDIMFEVTRISERPIGAMRMLADAIPFETTTAI